jgi:uncharacterized protein
LILRALTDETMQGVYVTTAPHPVTNNEFMRELRRVLHRPWTPPAPASAIRVASRLMNTDPELVLLGRRCVPTRLMKEGFRFEFPELGGALQDLLG